MGWGNFNMNYFFFLKTKKLNNAITMAGIIRKKSRDIISPGKKV